MVLKDFVGKVVVNSQTHKRYVIDRLNGVAITIRDEQPNENGWRATYRHLTGTAPYDNAIVNGVLLFEDQSLTEQFKHTYESYCNNEGKYDQYLYYSRCD